MDVKREFLRHTLATLAYRGGKAVLGGTARIRRVQNRRENAHAGGDSGARWRFARLGALSGEG